MSMQAFVREIESIDLTTPSANKMLLEQFRSLGQLSFPVLNILPEKELCIVRARKLASEKDFLHQVLDHSYNPHPKFTGQGRLNNPGQIIFYARSDFAGALAECKFMSGKNSGERVAFSFSFWRAVKEMKVVSIFNPNDIDLLSNSELVESLPSISDKYNELQEKGNDEKLVLFEFLANKLRAPVLPHEKYRYKITSVLANSLFESDPELAGIVYQSVQFRNKFNFAIQKKFIEERYFVPDHFLKGIYLVQGEGVREIESLRANDFNKETGKIYW